VHPALK
jgi:hypothetical protein